MDNIEPSDQAELASFVEYLTNASEDSVRQIFMPHPTYALDTHKLIRLSLTHKLLAIKCLRLCTTLGLKDAKDTIEMLNGTYKLDKSVTRPPESTYQTAYERVRDDLASSRKLIQNQQTELTNLRLQREVFDQQLLQLKDKIIKLQDRLLDGD